ncbi:MAG: hypothetical protein ACYCZN_01710 [Candidatus Dormibacteria bacterium]
MRTLAEARRQIVVGMRFQHTHHERPEVSGPRVVTKVRGTGFEYEFLDDRHVQANWSRFTQWLPAARMRVEGSQITWLRPNGEPWWTDEFREEVAA